MSGCGGVTGWCAAGRHDSCAHRLGGQQEDGVWQPECYVTIPKRGGAVVPPTDWGYLGYHYPMVVRPSHRWRCTCDCHQTGQIPLFGVSA